MFNLRLHRATQKGRDKVTESVLSLTPYQREIFNFFLNAYCKLKAVYMSQSTFARVVGCSLITVRRAIQRFKELNLISVTYYAGYQTLYLKPAQNVFLLVHDRFIRTIISAFKSLMFKQIQDHLVGFGEASLPAQNNDLEQNELRSYGISHKSYYNTHIDYDSNGRNTLETDIKNKIEKTVSMELDNTSKKKVSEMITENNKPHISPLMRKITETLNLSQCGQVKLLVYHEDALQATFNKFGLSSYYQDPFLWFETYCNGYSKAKGLPIQNELLDSMFKRLNVDPKASPILKNKPRSAPDQEIRPSISTKKLNNHFDVDKIKRIGMEFMISFIEEKKSSEVL